VTNSATSRSHPLPNEGAEANLASAPSSFSQEGT